MRIYRMRILDDEKYKEKHNSNKHHVYKFHIMCNIKDNNYIC